MQGFRLHIATVLFALATGPAYALALADCARTTHISHGGEILHEDMGQGRVMWIDWWSQEGTAKTVKIVECGGGEALSLRTAEERMNARPPFDKTEKALKRIATEQKAARAFATLPRIAAAVEDVARDIEISILTQEPCACAALYPEMRGTKAPFVLEDVTLNGKTRNETK